jgi:ketosteroid isomerase-like protein
MPAVKIPAKAKRRCSLIENVIKDNKGLRGGWSMTNAINLSPEEIKQKYQEYLACFNAKDFEGLKNYLAEDLYFYRFYGIRPFLGRAAMFAFYEEAWNHFNEHVTVNEMRFLNLELRSNCYFFIATIEVHLHIFKAWINGPYGTYLAGTEKHIVENKLYTLDEKGTIIAIM